MGNIERKEQAKGLLQIKTPCKVEIINNADYLNTKYAVSPVCKYCQKS